MCITYIQGIMYVYNYIPAQFQGISLHIDSSLPSFFLDLPMSMYCIAMLCDSILFDFPAAGYCEHRNYEPSWLELRAISKVPSV